MTRTYYVLRFEQTDALHQRGEQLMNADHALRIGQTATCDVRLPNDSQWEDAEWAVIEKTGEELRILSGKGEISLPLAKVAAVRLAVVF